LNSGVKSAAGPHPRALSRLYWLMLLVTVCWSGNIIAGKEALTGFGPLALAQMRVLSAAVIYAAGFLATRKVSSLRLSPRQWLSLIAAALSGVAFNQILFIGGLARSTVAHTGLIVALGPVIVLLIAVLMRMESLTGWKFVGIMISFGGVGVLTADKTSTGGGTHWVGDLTLLAGTAVFAVYTILMKDLANQYDSLTLNALVFILGAIFMLPFCARQAMRTPWGSLGFDAWWGWAFMVLFGTALPYLLFAQALRGLSASRVAAFSYLQPAIASGLAVWVLSEPLTVKVLVGGALILGGVYLTERGEESPAYARVGGSGVAGSSFLDERTGVAGSRSKG